MRNTSPDLVLVGGNLSNSKIVLKLLWNQNDYLSSSVTAEKLQARPNYTAEQPHK